MTGTSDHEILRARGVGGSGRALPRAPEGRVCDVNGCETQLSVYNPRPTCWLHEPRHRFTLFPGGRPPMSVHHFDLGL